MTKDRIYRAARLVGAAAMFVGGAMIVLAVVDVLGHDRGLLSTREWGRFTPSAHVFLGGLGVVAFGLMMRVDPVYRLRRDFIGRILHVIFLVVALYSFSRLAETGARFSAPPGASVGHATSAEMNAAMLQFAISIIVSGLAAWWVSGFPPFLIGTGTHTE